MKEPTMEEALELVEFERNRHGNLFVKSVLGSVWGSVEGSVHGDVCGSVGRNVDGDVFGSVLGSVDGKINGRKWQFVETPAEKAIRLIREGRGEEAIKVLEDAA